VVGKNDLAVRCEGLRKRYGDVVAVDELTVHVRRGEFFGLLGPNGAGKTTSFRMTVGLVKPDKGLVLLGGRECSRLPMYQRARLGMGYLPQEPSVFRRLSVRDNLLAVLETMPLSRKERNAEAGRLMADLELSHLASSIADTLSGGERRRLEISRALATRPSILLLDEPFAGVDPINVQEIQMLLEQMRAKNLGILITDHNVRETLKSTDRTYIIAEGQILREGTAQELVNDEQVKAVYLGHTFDQPIALGVTPAEERAIFRTEDGQRSGPISRAEQDEIQRGKSE